MLLSILSSTPTWTTMMHHLAWTWLHPTEQTVWFLKEKGEKWLRTKWKPDMSCKDDSRPFLSYCLPFFLFGLELENFCFCILTSVALNAIKLNTDQTTFGGCRQRCYVPDRTGLACPHTPVKLVWTHIHHHNHLWIIHGKCLCHLYRCKIQVKSRLFIKISFEG